jgi:hypothetical protein
MSKFFALGAVLAMLAAGASAKTLKITKAEVIQHRVAEGEQHRTPEPVDPAIHLQKLHLQKLRSEGALP